MKNTLDSTLRNSQRRWIGKLSVLFLLATFLGIDTKSIGARPIDSPPPQNGPTLTYYINGATSFAPDDFNAPITKHVIRVNHYFSDSGSAPRKGILCIHGFGDNSSIFEPLAQRLIATGKATDVYAVDLPGHGYSGLSTYPYFGPPVYGELDVLEYASVVQELLEQMVQIEFKNINTIVGHSLGGLVIQLIQDRLLYMSSSLRASFGIENTVLIASDIPGALPWSGGDLPITDPYSAKALVVNFKVTSTNILIGNYVDTPDAFFISSKYSVNNTPVSGAPSGANLAKLKNREPYAAAANIVGLDPSARTNNAVPRLGVRRNIWNGFNLKVAWLDKDPFFNQAESAGLADYLKAGLPLTVISDPEAVHGAPYSKPDLLLPLF